MTRALIPGLLFVLSIAAAAAEIPLGAPVFGEAHARQYAPAIASDGDGYFAVWLDERLGTKALFGARLRENGEAVDEHGILLVRNVTNSVGASVLWTGTTYVVLWQDVARVLALRVDRDGRVLGAPVILRDRVSLFSAASVHGQIVLAYTHWPAGSTRPELRVLTVDANLDELTDTVLAGFADYNTVSIAANDEDYLVAWAVIESSASFVHVRRLDASATPVGPARFIDAGWYPLVRGNGQDWLLVWLPGGAQPWTARSLSRDLSQRGPAGEVDARSALQPSAILWAGNTYKVFNVTFAGHTPPASYVNVVSMTPAGERTAIETIGSKSGWARVNASTNGTTALAVWEDELPGIARPDSRIMARQVSAAVPVGYVEPRVVTRSANGQNDVALAHGGEIDLVVWREMDRVYANRVARDGRLLDGRGIDLGEGDSPAVAFDGKQFVVACGEFASSPMTRVRFISPQDGLLSGELRVPIRGAMTLEAGGSGALLVTTDGHTVSAAMLHRELRAVLVATQLWEEETWSFSAYQIRAAWNGSEFLVTWSEYKQGGFFAPYRKVYQRIRGARVNANLTMLDTEPLVIGDVAGEGDQSPAVATDGREWLLAWQFGNNEVRARRIGADGVPRGDVAGTRIASGFAPSLAFDGEQYVVAWKSAPADSITGDEPREVRVSTIARTGPLPALAGTPLAETYFAEGISLVSATPRTFTVAYSRLTDAALGYVPRAFLQRLSSPARRRSVR